MALIKPVLGIYPTLGQNCFIADNATLIGDVVAGDNCSFWFGTVIRGDVNKIRIGHNVNIQDNATVHCTYQKTETHIGGNVSVGHNAIVHGCMLADNVLVGMGAIVMDGVKVGSGSIIGAGAVVPEGTVVEPGAIYAGIPAKKLKSVSQAHTAELIEGISRKYRMYARWFAEPEKHVNG